MNKKLNKEDVYKILSLIKTQKPIDFDYVFEIYDTSYGAILSLEENNIIRLGQPINSINLIQYIIGELTYSLLKRNQEETQKFLKDEKIKMQMASIVADKYMSMELFNYHEKSLGNKFLPPISSLDTYLNFMGNMLNKTPKNNPSETLVIDLLDKSVSIARCVLELLCKGFETEAMASWRTLHECECTLILLDKYRRPLIETYLKHMRYGIAYRGGVASKEETDKIFEQIKSEMKEHELKSKDMKKFIEYGWLYYTKEGEVENFKLNFRDGLQTAAGLHSYSKIYEASSEIVHSTPMLIYSNKVYYYLLTLLNLYESFFRIEKVFSDYFFAKSFQSQMGQYNQMRNIYYSQLTSIYKNERERFDSLVKIK